MPSNNKTLIIGLGNPILGDDGIGWVIAEEVQKLISESPEDESHDYEIMFLSLGGLSLMEHMEGFTKVFLFDSIHTGSYPNGTVFSLPLSKLPNLSSGHSTALHDTSLANALEMGKMMGLVLPDEVWVVAIETDQVYTFSEELSGFATSSITTALETLKNLLFKGDFQEKIIEKDS